MPISAGDGGTNYAMKASWSLISINIFTCDNSLGKKVEKSQPMSEDVLFPLRSLWDASPAIFRRHRMTCSPRTINHI